MLSIQTKNCMKNQNLNELCGMCFVDESESQIENVKISWIQCDEWYHTHCCKNLPKQESDPFYCFCCS